MGCSGGAVGGGRSSSGSRPVGAVGGAGSGAGGAGASRVMPSYQSRAGWNHSITIAAVTIAGNALAPGNPTKKKLVTKSGTASTDSASRAPLERRSAYQPRTAAAAARDRRDRPHHPQQRQHALHAEAELVTGRAGEVVLDGLPGVERRAARRPWPSAISTTTTDPPTISHPATVAWGGRTGFGSLMTILAESRVLAGAIPTGEPHSGVGTSTRPVCWRVQDLLQCQRATDDQVTDDRSAAP